MMLGLLTALGFFNNNNKVLGWEKRTDEDGTVMICLHTDEIIKEAVVESDVQFLDMIEIDGEMRPVFSYCNLAPMNDIHYYGPKTN